MSDANSNTSRKLGVLMTKKRVLYFFIIIFVCCILVYSVVQGAKKDVSVFQYPGRGLPHLSRDQEIVRLSEEIAAYIAPYKSISNNAGRLSFSDIDQFEYKSGKGITGKEYHLRVNLDIVKGTCIIKIGNVKYIVKNKGIVVHDGEKLIYSNDADPVRTITFWAFSYGATSTRIDSDKKSLVLERVSRKTPAFIQITLSDGCSGSIGPWMWIRGME